MNRKQIEEFERRLRNVAAVDGHDAVVRRQMHLAMASMPCEPWEREVWFRLAEQCAEWPEEGDVANLMAPVDAYVAQHGRPDVTEELDDEGYARRMEHALAAPLPVPA